MAKDLLQLFGTDAKAAEEGVWHTIRPGLRLRIARWNNPSFQRALEREMEPRRDAVEGDGLTEEEDRAIMARVVAQTIVTGWEGVAYEGEDLEFSPEAAERILADPRMRDFRLEVVRRAQMQDRYRIKNLEADRGNSAPRSGGN